MRQETYRKRDLHLKNEQCDVLVSYTVLDQPVGNNVKSIPILPNNMVLINQMRRAIIVFNFTPLRNWNLEQSSAKPNAPKSRNGKNKEKTWVSCGMVDRDHSFQHHLRGALSYRGGC